MTKSEIDRLGDALKTAFGSGQNLEIEALEAFRLSFRPAVEHIQETLSANFDVEFTQRPSKSTPSIVDKLARQPTLRLSQIQDVAGLRAVVLNLDVQNTLSTEIQQLFPKSKVVDRRVKPSYGYRGIHLVVTVLGKPVELQVRTAFQHAWAQLSEVLAGVLGHELKYGGGDISMQKYLQNLSDKIYQRELQISIQNENLTFDEVHKAFHQLAQFDTVQKELSKTL